MTEAQRMPQETIRWSKTIGRRPQRVRCGRETPRAVASRGSRVFRRPRPFASSRESVHRLSLGLVAEARASG
jgi:hypothetical protein